MSSTHNLALYGAHVWHEAKYSMEFDVIVFAAVHDQRNGETVMKFSARGPYTPT